MIDSKQKNEYKLLILDRIKDSTEANSVMEIIANKHGDEALATVIADMEAVDIARLFNESFDYTKPSQAAALINSETASQCIFAILARRSESRIKESPDSAVSDINDFITSVVLTRSIEKQIEFKSFVHEHMDLAAACLMHFFSYHGEELLDIISIGEQGTIAEVASNLGLTTDLKKAVINGMGKKNRDRRPDEEDDSAGCFDESSEERRSKFIRATLIKYHREALEKFGSDAVTSMEEFMDM